jgi:acyl transferase domain-containing protein
MPQHQVSSVTCAPSDLRGAHSGEQHRLLTDLICREVDAVLGDLGPETIDPTVGFHDIGFDSRTAIELRDRLAAETELALPAAVIFDHPTVNLLADHLRQLLGTVDGEGETQEVEPPMRVSEATHDDPVVIVGMACRYPGEVSSPEDLWRIVAEGRDAISGFPTDRGWPDDVYDPEPGSAGKTYVREGGFLDGAGEFDAGFFGISAREALAMDPQQRLLLEVAWEAIERAGIDPGSLRGTDTGVFVGLSDMGYRSVLAAGAELQGAESYLLTGNMPSVASGRIAYFLGLEGPAVSLDTACSSSLVAVHQAVQSLRSGESSLALAGGVTVTMSPLGYVLFAQQRGLAFDGRCKSYSSSADGTAWSEGVGLVVLERLSDARRNGHRVAAVVRGSAVNQDGTSNGLTAPNGLSQQRVIRRALANAGLSAADVDVVEGHGTGTVLGDPIEAQALLSTYGQRPPGQPLLLGSVKSNIGHTQSAAGVAGLIKMVLAMQHGVVPPTLHVDAPSSHVDWSTGQILLAKESQPWPERDRPRRSGISSFGISGTNAHVIVEYDPADSNAVGTTPDCPERDSAPALPCVLSAKTESALRGQAGRLRGSCEAAPGGSVADLGYSLATTRATFDHRAVVVAGSRAELLDGLGALTQGAFSTAVITGRASARGKTGLLLPGQGSQVLGMGRELYQEFPTFARAFDDLCAAFDTHIDRSLRSVIFGENGSDIDTLNRTEYTQPALFTIESAMLRLLESWGFKPDFVVGHSIGELAAAHFGGVFSLDDAAAVVAARGALMQGLRPGAMVSLRASLEEVADSLSGYELGVSIAASNGPNATVIAGDDDAVTAIAKHWREHGRQTKRLQVERAFHSPHLDGMLDEYRRILSKVDLRSSSIPLMSNVTGARATTEQLCSPDYWVSQARQPVLFRDCVASLAEAGVETFVEVGPGDVLAGMTYECLAGVAGTSVATLRRGESERRGLLRAIAAAWVRGAAVDWGAVYSGHDTHVVDLPTYAFQHRHYWSGFEGVTPAVEQQIDSGPEFDPGQAFREQLAELPESGKLDFALGVVRSQIKEILDIEDEIHSDSPLVEVGLTSLSMLELRGRLNFYTGQSLSLESLLANPTVGAVAGLISTTTADAA